MICRQIIKLTCYLKTYKVEDDDRNNRTIGMANVCHQSFAVEDEEDGAEVINYAIQQVESNHANNRFDELNEGNPPPLPESSPPIYNNGGIKQENGDRHSLGGSSYDKVGKH